MPRSAPRSDLMGGKKTSMLASEIIIDDEIRAIIPALRNEEYEQLEENLKTDGCRDSLVVWKDHSILLDGHNRLEICNRNKIEFGILEMVFPDKDAAKMWVIMNQLGRRNLTTYQWCELANHLKPIFEKRAKKHQGTRTDLIDVNIPPTLAEGVETREECAKIAGVSHGTWDKFEMLNEEAPDDIKSQLRLGDLSINGAYNLLKREKKTKEYAEKVKEVINAPVPPNKYRCIVIDPPWPIEKINREVRPLQIGYDYPAMTVDEIRNFPVNEIADDDCHLYLWTTQRYLPKAFEILENWGFKYIFTMVWHKSGGFQPFGLPQYNCEFVLFGRKGALPFLDLKDFFVCFGGERREHSRKPEVFYDLTNRVSPGPRIDIFSREKRDGFEQYGNETDKFEGG